MKKYFKNKKQILSKLRISLLCLTVYLFGSYVTLPLLDISKIIEESKSEKIDYVASITYNQVETYSIFSLGLTSWIFTLIFWRILSLVFKESISKISEKNTHIYQSIITFSIALLQAYVKSLRLREIAVEAVLGNNMLNYLWILLLIAGAFFLIWLVKINTDYGIGGASIFILMNIVINGIQSFSKFITENGEVNFLSKPTWIIFVFSLVLMIVFIVYIEKAELRISIHRVMLQSSYAGMSYLPIKLISAGSLPIIYSLTLFQVIQLIFQILNNIYTHNYFIEYMAENMTLTSLTGISIYWVILVLLSYLFVKINLSVEDIGKQMLYSGDYIDGINPGKDTLTYLQKKSKQYGYINAVIYLCLVGLPLLIGYISPDYYYLGTIPGTLLILVIMVLNFVDQFSVLQIPSKYNSIFE